jgi:hypothetical protein
MTALVCALSVGGVASGEPTPSDPPRQNPPRQDPPKPEPVPPTPRGDSIQDPAGNDQLPDTGAGDVEPGPAQDPPPPCGSTDAPCGGSGQSCEGTDGPCDGDPAPDPFHDPGPCERPDESCDDPAAPAPEDEHCECLSMDARLIAPEEKEARPFGDLWGWTFRIELERTCSGAEQSRRCEGGDAVVESSTEGASIGWSKEADAGEPVSVLYECEHDGCGVTKESYSLPVGLLPKLLARSYRKPVKVVLTIHAYCPGEEDSTEAKTITLNFGNGKFRPAYSDLDGDGKVDGKKK